MRGCSGVLPWLGLLLVLLALLQPAWAVLRVSVPFSPIRAPPGSDVRLPCNISDSSGSLSLSKLAVVWKKGEEIIAEYEDDFKAMKPGANMSVPQLLNGDATLLLEKVQDSDASVYSCFVIHMPNKGEGRVELKVEAPPHITCSSTKVQLNEPSTVKCNLSEFYPSHISVEWLRNNVVVKGPELPLPSKRDGLFSADSVLELTPQLADVDANFSCRVRHQALEGLLHKDFQLQVQARPIAQDLIVLEERNWRVAKCLLSGFYPKEIKVLWLRNEKPQETMQSEPRQMPNGTFTISSSIIQSESDPAATYVCQVLHVSLAVPLKLTAHWQQKGESENITCPTSSPSQSTEKKLTCHETQPALIPASPTGSSCPEHFELGVHPYVWFGLMLVFVVSAIVLGAGMLYYKKQGKCKSASRTKDEPKKLEDNSVCSEKENLNASTVSKL